MAKKKINAKFEAAKAETKKNGKLKNKFIVEDTKKRGVKKGTKRNPYKPRKNKTNAIISNNITTDSNNVNTDLHKTEGKINESIDNTIQNTETEVKTETKLIDKSEDKYKKFLSDYSENDNSETKTDSEVKTDNKSYDFTQTNNSSQQVNPQLTGIQKNNSVLVNGYMLLALCDFVIPNGLIWIYKMIDERANEINASEVKLDSEQKESLKESANLAAQYIFQTVNPLVIFFVGMGVMYATNIQTKISVIPKKIKVKQIKKIKK